MFEAIVDNTQRTMDDQQWTTMHTQQQTLNEGNSSLSDYGSDMLKSTLYLNCWEKQASV